jgi:Hemerythrin HHE cation binding domain
MSETTSLPTLFGRFTAILSEHERFGVTLRRISAACPALESEHPAIAPDLQPGSLFADLFAELSQHFVVEEAEAYFGTLVQERPTLLHRVAELKAEHGAMLKTITELCAITADDPES